MCKAKQMLNCSIDRRMWDGGGGAGEESGQPSKIRRCRWPGEENRSQSRLQSGLKTDPPFLPNRDDPRLLCSGFVELKPEPVITF